MESIELKSILQEAQQFCQQKSISIVWDLPVPFSDCHPIAVEISEQKEYLSGAGRAWLYVEPDGDVLPDQGDTKKLGNFLTDDWNVIWKKV
jgi:MoaA/NifB/PqqE/SkfB family radical SAM enzyme